ncbi:MAG TPA: FMN-binding protein [Candidatus Humimicrobiaceae bacterium]
MKINLKKILVSLLMIVGFVSYAGYQRYFVGQQAPVTNPPLDTAAADTTTFGMVSSTTVSQAETTLPPADTTFASRNNGIRSDEKDNKENDDGDGGFIPPQTTTSSSSQTSTSGSSTTTSTTSGSSSSTNTTPTTGTTAIVANALYKDGQFDGNVSDAYYGQVQVRAIIQGGQLTDVQFLRYPSDRRYSVEINTYAMPILKSEAIQAQNTNVNIVSGATYSSFAFVDSLSNALNQAQV